MAFSHVPRQSRSFQACHGSVEQDLENSASIREYFENWFRDEAVPVPKRRAEIRSVEDEQAFTLLEGSTKRLPGKNAFESGILWRESSPIIPNNRQPAEAHHRSLEKRLERDHTLASAYQASTESDVANGYIRKMIQEEITSLDVSASTMAYCLLHHPVKNPKKPGKVQRGRQTPGEMPQ